MHCLGWLRMHCVAQTGLRSAVLLRLGLLSPGVTGLRAVVSASHVSVASVDYVLGDNGEGEVAVVAWAPETWLQTWRAPAPITQGTPVGTW